MAKKKKTTDELVEGLAVMVQRGFAGTKSDLEDFRKDVDNFRKEVNHRFDRVEFHLSSHERRIEVLEDKMRLVSTKIGLRK